jgi:hypothetical protein
VKGRPFRAQRKHRQWPTLAHADWADPVDETMRQTRAYGGETAARLTGGQGQALERHHTMVQYMATWLHGYLATCCFASPDEDSELPN